MGKTKSKIKKKKRRQELATQKEVVLSNSRKVCHECGEEITHRERFQIYKAECGVMTVCSLCHARHIRKVPLATANR